MHSASWTYSFVFSGNILRQHVWSIWSLEKVNIYLMALNTVIKGTFSVNLHSGKQCLYWNLLSLSKSCCTLHFLTKKNWYKVSQPFRAGCLCRTVSSAQCQDKIKCWGGRTEGISPLIQEACSVQLFSALLLHYKALYDTFYKLWSIFFIIIQQKIQF